LSKRTLGVQGVQSIAMNLQGAAATMDCSSVSIAPMAMSLVRGLEAPILGARKAEEKRAFRDGLVKSGAHAFYSFRVTPTVGCCEANIAGLRRRVFSRGLIFFRFARIGQQYLGGGRSAKRTRSVLLARDAKSRVEVDVDGLRRRLPDRDKPAIARLRLTASTNN
jgi:hypothetical protein